VFSPSGIEAVEKSCVRCSKLKEWWKLSKKVAIGQTTATALKEKGYVVDAVAKKPTAKDLLQAVTDAR
jgi:uroporphyrinogen-III synthase